MKKYRVIGLMSGTSLDGLDIAYCEFRKEKSWKVRIHQAQTIKYSSRWRQALEAAFGLGKSALRELDRTYGEFIGKEVLKFIEKFGIKPDLIASHGHTVFHKPEKGITLQIGSGERIAAICRIPVVCDFRSGDVALGGQGAPLVPIADRTLFSTYDFCLNLGGIANISYERAGRRTAFDICPVNMVLNKLSGQFGKEFDRGGKMASQGNINEKLLDQLNALPFYRVKPPKSIGREWVETEFFPVMNSFRIPVKDKLRTAVEHMGMQIGTCVQNPSSSRRSTLLVTGGGAYNAFLVERIARHAKCAVTVPDDKTIQFKEAMAFALLGLLRMQGKINILKSVTGAKRDSSGGKVCFPGQKALSSL